MPKIIDAKKTILERVAARHKQAVAESRNGEQSQTWQWIDDGLSWCADVLRISGGILRFFTTRLLLSGLRAVNAGVTTFFTEMGRDSQCKSCYEYLHGRKP